MSKRKKDQSINNNNLITSYFNKLPKSTTKQNLTETIAESNQRQDDNDAESEEDEINDDSTTTPKASTRPTISKNAGNLSESDDEEEEAQLHCSDSEEEKNDETIRNIKIRLSSIISDNDKEAKINYIETLVIDMAKATFDAYNYANYFVHRAIEQSKNIGPLNQQFFVYCLNSVTFKTRKAGRQAHDSDYMKKVARELDTKGFTNSYKICRDNRSHMISEIAKEMETMIFNCLSDAQEI